MTWIGWLVTGVVVAFYGYVLLDLAAFRRRLVRDRARDARLRAMAAHPSNGPDAKP